MTENGNAIASESENPPERKARERKSSALSGAAREPEAEAYRMAADESAAPANNDPMTAVIEAAVTSEFEFVQELGREGLETAETVALSLAERFRELAGESASCTKEFLGCGYAFAGELRQAKSPLAAVEIQIDFARSAYVRLLDHFLKVSGLYWDFLRQACSAAELDVAKVKC